MNSISSFFSSFFFTGADTGFQKGEGRGVDIHNGILNYPCPLPSPSRTYGPGMGGSPGIKKRKDFSFDFVKIKEEREEQFC